MINKDMIIADILKLDRETAPVFFKHGLHCIGCPSASGESLEDACKIHGIDVDSLLGELNDFMASKSK